MATEAMTLAIDQVPDRDKEEKRCTNCGHPKILDEFARNPTKRDGRSSWCLWCTRIYRYQHYHEGGGKEYVAAYNARPEVKARRREYHHARKEQRNASKRTYNRSPRGRIVKCRSWARGELRKAVTDERRARLEQLIAAYDRELARMEAGHELPPEPPKARAARKCGKSPMRGIYLTPAGTYEVKISVGKSKSVRGGTFATLDEARDAANALAFRLKGVKDYATPREERRRA